MSTRTIVVVAVSTLGFWGWNPSSATAQDSQRGWVDVNLGAAHAAEESYTTSLSDIRFGERATFEGGYSFPRGGAFDFGGGYMITPVVGIGVSFSGTGHTDTALMSVSIPHPLLRSRFGTDIAETDRDFVRAEGGMHLQAMINATPTAERFRIRVFGGPTLFRVKQDTFDDIRYVQQFNLLGTNLVDITTYQSSEEEATGWGFHGGSDVAVFFSRVVGVGGFVRLSSGQVELPDYGGLSEVKVGGLQYGGGLRLKF